MSNARPPADTMIVAACSGDGQVRPEVRPRPRPGRGELVLDLIWCGLCGTDLFKLDNGLAPQGTVLGHELVGTVSDVGTDRSAFSIGDRVVVPHHVACGECPLCRRGSRTLCTVFKENLMSPGGLAEHILIGERAVRQAARKIPDHVGSDAAAFLEPAACVLRGIDKAGLSDPTSCVIVVGAGSMGLLHLLTLRAVAPESRVVVTDLLDDRRTTAVDLGAAASCHPDDLKDVAAEVSGGLGADALFDTVGGARILATGLGALRPGGTVVLFAHAGAGEHADFELNPLFKNEQRVVATYSGSLPEQDRIADLIFSGALDPGPLVSHYLPLDRAAEAVDLARARRALKILIGPPNQDGAA